MEKKRIEVATLLSAWLKAPAISKMLNMTERTVYNAKKRLSEGEDLQDKPRSGKPQKLSAETVLASFKKHPRMPMRKFAKKMSVSHSTVSRAIKKAGGKSLKLTDRPLLTENQKSSRLDRCKKLLNYLKHNPDCLVFFSDEKTIQL